MVLEEDLADIATPTGPMRTYVYRPVAPGRYPGLVFFSEVFQQTGPIKRAACMMAGHGFVVAVPEIYHELTAPGTVLAYDTAGADLGNKYKTGKPIGAYDADARAVVSYLQSQPKCTGKIGAMGLCVGGHLAFRAAMDPRVLAGACFYPTDIHKGSLGAGGDDSLSRIGDIRGEVMMVWGRQDPHTPAEGRALIHQRLDDAKVNFTWHEVNAAHAFMRDEGPRYDPALALTYYRMAIDLFYRKLGEGDVGHDPSTARGPAETKQ